MRVRQSHTHAPRTHARAHRVKETNRNRGRQRQRTSERQIVRDCQTKTVRDRGRQ